MSKMINIQLYGKLKKIVGGNIRLNVKSPSEAMRAIFANFPEARSVVENGNWYVWKSKDGKRDAVGEQTLRFPLGTSDTLHIMPAGHLSGIETGTAILIGGILLASASVAIAVFMPIPAAPNPNDREANDDRTSSVLDRPVGRIAQGHPGALIYGEVITSLHVVSSTVEITDASSNLFGGDGSDDGGVYADGSGAWTGGWNSGSFQLQKGGKSGGGTTTTGQEDPNTLVSNSIAKFIGIIGVGKQYGPPSADILQDVFIDDTPVHDDAGNDNYPGFAIQVRTGDDDQDYVDGFAFSAASIQKNTQIQKSVGSVIHTVTDPNIDSLSLTFKIPSLHKLDADNGALLRHTVDLQVELQSAAGGYGVVIPTARFSGKCTSAYQRQYKINLPQGGHPWNARITRLSSDSGSAKIQDSTYLDFVTETIDQKFSWPGISYVAVTLNAKLFGSRNPKITIRWRGRVMQVPDNFDPVTRTYDGVWGGNFKEAYCDDPAWAAHDIATNDFFGAGKLTRGMVDKWTIYAASIHNNGMVPDGNGGTEQRYRISTVINTREQAIKLIGYIAGTFKSHPYWGPTGLTIFQDRPVLDGDKKLLVPANISEDGIVYDTATTENEFSASVKWWNNIDDHYNPTPAIERDPDMVRRIGFEAKESSAIGAPTEAAAKREARWELEDQAYLSNFATVNVSRAQSNIMPGHVIKAHDPRRTVGSMGGLLAGISGTTMTLDRPVAIDASKSFTILAILPNGELEKRDVENPTGPHTDIVINAPFSVDPVLDAVWALESDDVKLQEFRVLERSSIKGGYSLRLKVYDETSWSRVEDGVSIDPAPTTNLPTGPLNKVAAESIGIFEFQKIDGNSSVPSVLISWSSSGDPRVVRYDAEISATDGQGYTLIAGDEEISREIIGVDSGDISIRVRPVDSLGRSGGWASAQFTLEAGNQALPEITNLSVQSDNEALQAWIQWDHPTDVRPFRYEIFKGLTNDIPNAELIGQTDRRRQVITEAGNYFVRTAYMDVRSENPSAISVLDADLAVPVWERIEDRPQTLSDLDASADQAIADNTTDVVGLIATYGTTASSAASAALAAASASASMQAEINSETAQGLAEAASAAAAVSEGNAAVFNTSALAASAAAAAAEVVSANAATAAQRAAMVTHPYLLNDRSYFTSSSLLGVPETVPDISDVDWALVNDPDIGDSFESNAKKYIAHKEQYSLGNIGDYWNFFFKGKPTTDSTTGTQNKVNTYVYFFDGSRNFINSAYIGTSGTVLVSGGVFEIDITTDLSSIAPVGTVYFRPYIYNNVSDASGDATARFSEFKITNNTNKILAEQAASAAASSESSAAASNSTAGQFALAAQTAATDAETAEANAAVHESNSAASATDSEGSAAAAAASQALTATAQLAAEAAEAAALISENNSATNAIASASSASAAAASQTATSASAAAAAESEVNADTAAGNASVSETNSALSESNSAASATDSANSVVVAQAVLNVVASVSSPGNIVRNGTFAKWNDGAVRPVGYVNYGTPLTAVKEETIIRDGNPCIRQTTDAVTVAGVNARTYRTDDGGGTVPYGVEKGVIYPLQFSQYWVVETQVYLVSGSWDGSGVYFNVRNGSTDTAGGTSWKTRHTDFTDYNLPTGKWVTVRKFIDFGATAEANVDGVMIYCMSNYSGYGTGFAVKDIIWGSLIARPATDQEINAEIAYPVLDASVSLNSTAIASNSARLSTASFEVSTTAGGTETLVSLYSDSTGTSEIGLGAKKVFIFDPNGDPQEAIVFQGGNILMTGDLEVGGGIYFGSGTGRWPIALANKDFGNLKDGDTVDINFPGSGVPIVRFDKTNLSPLAAGESYSLAAENLTTTSCIIRAKKSTSGTPTSVSNTVDTAGTGSDPDRVMNKTHGDASNFLYTFRVQGLLGVEVFDDEPPFFDVWGIANITTKFNDGTGWVDGPVIVINQNDVNHGDVSGTYAYDKTVTVSFADPIGQVAGNEFGVDLGFSTTGTTLTNLVSVAWITASQSGETSATSGAYSLSITVEPPNV